MDYSTHKTAYSRHKIAYNTHKTAYSTHETLQCARHMHIHRKWYLPSKKQIWTQASRKVSLWERAVLNLALTPIWIRYVHIRIYVYIYIHIHICICILVYINIYTSMYVYLSGRALWERAVSNPAWPPLWIRCICVCVCVYQT